jgi:DNA repair protein RecN (Recombination protein N)
LVELRVRNLGVIEDVTISLGPGMTALTGETGAGKTLVVEAIALLLGGRADPSVVRSGADEAVVEGRFVGDGGAAGGAGDEDAGAGDEGEGEGEGEGDEILLARSVVRGGRSRAWIDGRMASIGALAEVAEGLIELHGQHQHRTLVRTEAQRAALDHFGRIELHGLESARAELRRLQRESLELGGDARERAREADLLTYQLDEISSAQIEDGEEDARLEGEEDRLAAAASCRESAAGALSMLAGVAGGGGESGSDADESALGRLAEASRLLTGNDPLAPFDARLRATMIDLSDLTGELRSVVETWEEDPQRLEQVRSRRQLFRELERKYGDDLGEVLAFGEWARERLAEIERQGQRAAALDQEIANALEVVGAAEAEVATARREAAPRFAGQVQATLRELAMGSARFSVSVEGVGAADDVEFLLGANPGEPLLPLAKTASGGELARTMLAIRLAVTDTQGAMVFDEVDAGVGGSAATAVGSALAELGRHAQVLVVTHLAQVAAQADRQLGVAKSEHEGRTRTEVRSLEGDARVVELSRMLSGSPGSDSARLHARELLEQVGGRAHAG